MEIMHTKEQKKQTGNFGVRFFVWFGLSFLTEITALHMYLLEMFTVSIVTSGSSDPWKP